MDSTSMSDAPLTSSPRIADCGHGGACTWGRPSTRSQPLDGARPLPPLTDPCILPPPPRHATPKTCSMHTTKVSLALQAMLCVTSLCGTGLALLSQLLLPPSCDGPAEWRPATKLRKQRPGNKHAENQRGRVRAARLLGPGAKRSALVVLGRWVLMVLGWPGRWWDLGEEVVCPWCGARGSDAVACLPVPWGTDVHPLWAMYSCSQPRSSHMQAGSCRHCRCVIVCRHMYWQDTPHFASIPYHMQCPRTIIIIIIITCSSLCCRLALATKARHACARSSCVRMTLRCSAHTAPQRVKVYMYVRYALPYSGAWN